MYQSPRLRRLRNDLAALERLRSESSVFRFSNKGDPAHQYDLVFRGKGLWRDRGKIRILETHRVEIKLGASYPRTIPEIRWITPIYHPNISEIGMVCLGGYGTHWVPSVQLDELCIMLWDMVRYHNYDIRSPYNRDAALWVASQTSILFPTDGRSLRDLRAALGRVDPSKEAGTTASAGAVGNGAAKPAGRVRQFVERYGRAFAGSGRPEPANPADPVAARVLPRNPELQDLVAAQLEPDVRGDSPGSGGGDEVQTDDGVLILETHSTRPPAPAEPAAAGLPSDEILFIE